MKIKAFALFALLNEASAFAPTAFTRSTKTSSTTRNAIVDPSVFHDMPQHMDTLSNIFSSINLADADLSAAADTVSSASAAAAPAVAEVAQEAATVDNGWFGFLAGPIEFTLELLHGGLNAAGLSANSWGVSILMMTTLIKILTYPLTAQQLESTAKMQVSDVLSVLRKVELRCIFIHKFPILPFEMEMERLCNLLLKKFKRNINQTLK